MGNKLIEMIEINKAQLKDVEEIVKLRKKLYEFYAKIDEKEYGLKKNAFELLKKETKKNLKSNKYVSYVAKKEGKIVGFVQGVIKNNYPIFKLKKKGRIGEIFKIEKYRSKKIGPKLVNQVLEIFKKKNLRYVDVVADVRNNISLNFWQKQRFRSKQNILVKKI